MEYVKLGKSGLKVSRICLGCMTYGDPGWRPWVLGETGVLTDDLAGALGNVPTGLGERAARRVREQFPVEQVAPRLRALHASMV